MLEINTRSGKIIKDWKLDQDGAWMLVVTPDDRKIYTANLEGKSVSVIDRRAKAVRSISFESSQIGMDISPSGREVFQWRETSNFQDDKRWRICMINADGSNFHIITSGEANDQVPNWSRDGRRLIFYSDRSGKDQIYTMKPDGSDVQRLHTSEGNDHAASWSLDNHKIVFTSDRLGNSDVYVME